MKIRYKENFVVFFDVFFGSILLFISSLGYFLGFPVNINTLPYYFIVVISIFLIMVSIYVIYRIFCKTFILFDNENVSIDKNGNIIFRIEYKKIMSAKYCNIFNLLFGYPEGGNLVIEYLDVNNKKANIYIALSMRKLKKIKFNYYSF